MGRTAVSSSFPYGYAGQCEQRLRILAKRLEAGEPVGRELATLEKEVAQLTDALKDGPPVEASAAWLARAEVVGRRLTIPADVVAKSAPVRLVERLQKLVGRLLTPEIVLEIHGALSEEISAIELEAHRQETGRSEAVASQARLEAFRKLLALLECG
jgi:hypothetical protein